MAFRKQVKFRPKSRTGSTISTKYGVVATIVENGKKKIDFGNCDFHSTNDFMAFLYDTDLTTKIFGY